MTSDENAIWGVLFLLAIYFIARINPHPFLFLIRKVSIFLVDLAFLCQIKRLTYLLAVRIKIFLVYKNWDYFIKLITGESDECIFCFILGIVCSFWTVLLL